MKKTAAFLLGILMVLVIAASPYSTFPVIKTTDFIRDLMTATTAAEAREKLETIPITNPTITNRLYIATATNTAPLGSELIVNGTLGSDLSGWTAGTGWSYSSGALHAPGNTEALSQSVTLIANRHYYVLVKVKVAATAGTLTATFGAMPGSYSVITNGLSVGNNPLAWFAAASGSYVFTLTPSTDYDGTVTGVSIREVTLAGMAPVLSITNTLGQRVTDIYAPGLPDGLLYDHPADWGAQSIGIGEMALYHNVSGFQNTAVGAQAMQNNVVGIWNSAFGQGALFGNYTGRGNSAVGMAANQYNTIGSWNSSLGYYSLYSNTTGSNNVAIGANALHAITTGSGNIGVGYMSLKTAVSTTQNTAVGYQSALNTTGDANTAVGWKTLYNNNSGQDNTAVGVNALTSNTSGRNNTALGEAALFSSQTVNNSTAVGYYALATSTAADNTAAGASALQSNTSGTENTAVGKSAGKGGNANTTGSQNTFLGANATLASSTQRSHLTVVGADAVGDASNAVILGRTTDKTGVAVTSPHSTLQIGGSMARALTVGSTVTLSDAHSYYLLNVDGQTVTLPTAVGCQGREYVIKTITPAASGTIATTSSQLIDGGATYSLSASNKFVRVVSDNANWWIIGQN